MSSEYDPETVRRKVASFPELFGNDYCVIEIPDTVATRRGTHRTGETLFVARITEATDEYVELSDIYRVTRRPDCASGTQVAPHLFFVAKHWDDTRLSREEIRIH